MRGLKELMAEYSVPFVKIVSGNSFKLGSSGAVTLQFLDGLGNAVSAKDQSLKKLMLEYTKGEAIDVTDVANIDSSAGRVKLNLEKVQNLRHGNFRLRVELSGSMSKKLITAELVSVTTTISMQNFAYELHKEDGASDDLREGTLKQWTYPEKVTELSKGEGTDDVKLFFTAKISLLDAKQ